MWYPNPQRVGRTLIRELCNLLTTVPIATSCQQLRGKRGDTGIDWNWARQDPRHLQSLLAHCIVVLQSLCVRELANVCVCVLSKLFGVLLAIVVCVCSYILAPHCVPLSLHVCKVFRCQMRTQALWFPGMVSEEAPLASERWETRISRWQLLDEQFQ